MITLTLYVHPITKTKKSIPPFDRVFIDSLCIFFSQKSTDKDEKGGFWKVKIRDQVIYEKKTDSRIDIDATLEDDTFFAYMNI